MTKKVLISYFLCSALYCGIGFSENLHGPVVVDTFPTFLQTWREATSQADAAAVDSFKANVVPLANDLYQILFSYQKSQGINTDQHIIEQLRSFERIQDRSIQLHKQISSHIREDLQSFLAKFSDFNSTQSEVVILHSLGGSNGAIVPANGKYVFYLGIDMIALHNDFENQTPFFHHEFFHAYHVQKFQPSKKFYSQLWMEGLAVYVAKEMNPTATDPELLLDAPQGLIQNTEDKIQVLLTEIEDHLETEDPSLNFKYFNIASLDQIVPIRSGYYLGYRVVQIIAKNHSSSEMANMQEAEILPKIRQAIAVLQKEAKPNNH